MALMAIRKLPPLLISQIAAGEVVERPASVVKELVENSLDADATRIEIAIEEGGHRLMRVCDNGLGIAPEQLHLAVAPHATSKLDTPEMLARIATLGFRGEALASIASVSRMRVTSRHTRDSTPVEAGATLEAAGQNITQPVPAACAPGTTIEIRDLFFNTPARRKFLRTASTEFGHIAQAVTRIAMAHPDVAFKLTHGTRTAIDTPTGQSPRRRCIELLGNELDDAMLEFEATAPPVVTDDDNPTAKPTTLWGLAGIPTVARATSKFQYLFLNGRPIRDRNISHAVKEAYRGLIPPNKQPVAVVVIETDPSAVDINVHPAKTEVRFRNAVSMHGLVLSAMRQRLLGSDLTPSATLGDASFDEATQPSTHHTTPQSDQPPASGPGSKATPDRDTASGSPPSPHLEPTILVDDVHRPAPAQKGFDLEQTKQALDDHRVEDHATHTGIPSPTSKATASPVGEPTPTQAAAMPPSPRDILQVHDSYLVTQDDQGLIIIDQHALHERVMFEQLRKRVLGGDDANAGAPKNLESQRLLTPAVIKTTPSRTALLEPLKPLTRRIGIEADPIGPDAVAIHAFPSFLFDRNVDPIEFFEELLDRVEEGDIQLPATHTGDQNPSAANTETDQNQPAAPNANHVEEAVLHKVLDMMSCKAAVKAGDHMTSQEMASLLAQREAIERSSSCPHGRPTTIRLTLRDMEKQFKRT